MSSFVRRDYMKKTFHTPEGITTRELTPEEIPLFPDAKAADDFSKSGQLSEKINIIAKYLGLME